MHILHSSNDKIFTCYSYISSAKVWSYLASYFIQHGWDQVKVWILKVKISHSKCISTQFLLLSEINLSPEFWLKPEKSHQNSGNGWLFSLAKVNITNFQRPLLNCQFITDFKGLENGRSWSPNFSKTFQDCKNPALITLPRGLMCCLVLSWKAMNRGDIVRYSPTKMQ